MFESNIRKLCFLPAILNLKTYFQKVNQCDMKYKVTEFTRQVEFKFPKKNSVKQNSETTAAPNLLL